MSVMDNLLGNATTLKAALLLRGGSNTVVINVPRYLSEMSSAKKPEEHSQEQVPCP